MGILIKAVEMLGLFNRAKKWMQGKKTYAVNIVQALGGLSVMLGLAAQMLDLVGKSILLAMGWSDSVGDPAAWRHPCSSCGQATR